jgi:hypothetical protein
MSKEAREAAIKLLNNLKPMLKEKIESLTKANADTKKVAKKKKDANGKEIDARTKRIKEQNKIPEFKKSEFLENPRTTLKTSLRKEDDDTVDKKHARYFKKDDGAMTDPESLMMSAKMRKASPGEMASKQVSQPKAPQAKTAMPKVPSLAGGSSSAQPQKLIPKTPTIPQPKIAAQGVGGGAQKPNTAAKPPKPLQSFMSNKGNKGA